MPSYAVSGELTCESSRWKVFVRNTKQLELNCLGLCIYSWERQRLYLWISLNLVWHSSMLTWLILVFTPGNSVRCLELDEMDHCHFFPLFIFCKSAAQKEQTSPCRRNRLRHQSRVTAASSMLGRCALAEARSPFSAGGSRGHGLPVLAVERAPASHPLPWGLCAVVQHPAAPVFSEVNLGHVLLC